jgi:hypothetical protein
MAAVQPISQIDVPLRKVHQQLVVQMMEQVLPLAVLRRMDDVQLEPFEVLLVALPEVVLLAQPRDAVLLLPHLRLQIPRLAYAVLLAAAAAVLLAAVVAVVAAVVLLLPFQHLFFAAVLPLFFPLGSLVRLRRVLQLHVELVSLFLVLSAVLLVQVVAAVVLAHVDLLLPL